VTEVRVVRSEDFGQECLRALLEAIGKVPSPVVGLPTGDTPVALFEAVKAAAEAGELDISAWRPFAIDEYGGPGEHACSNRAFFRRRWDVIPGAPPVEQFDPEAPDIDAECARVATALEKAGGLTVALLGVGMNGHLAFNEPGSSPESSLRRVELHNASRESARPCFGDAAPTWGLTLGLRELLGARRVVVMANGPAKAAIVASALDGPETPARPESFARGEHVTWVLDVASAAGLRGPSG